MSVRLSLFCVAALIWVITRPVACLSDDSTSVIFIHGFQESKWAWYDIAELVENRYYAETFRPEYNSEMMNIQQMANSVVSQLDFANYEVDSTIWICNSLGGLVGREIARSHGENIPIKHMITTGTPHNGAKIADYAIDGRPDLTISGWVRGLTLPIRALLPRWSENYVFERFIDPHVSELITTVEKKVEEYRVPAVYQLRPNSSYIAEINDYYDLRRNLPGHLVMIYGVEQGPKLARLADTVMNDGVETGEVLEKRNALAAIYLAGATRFGRFADISNTVWLLTWNPVAWMFRNLNESIASAFNVGFYTLLGATERDWGMYCGYYNYPENFIGLDMWNGFDHTRYVIDPSDALFSIETAAPIDVLGLSEYSRVPVASLNHMELITTLVWDSALQRVLDTQGFPIIPR